MTVISLNFQYGATYQTSQYVVPPGTFSGTPTSNGQVNNIFIDFVIIRATAVQLVVTNYLICQFT